MANDSVVNALINSYMPQPGDEDLMPPTAGYQNPERDVNSILSIAGARLSDRLSDAGVSIAQALMAPGNALMGNYDQRPVYDDGRIGMFDPRMERDALELAGVVSLGGMPLPRPSNSLGMFGGVRAQTADRAALARAQDMEASGAARDAIWNDTGWFKGADGQWRFEIDDSASLYNQNAMVPKDYGPVMGREGAARDVLTHPSIYDAYPDLAGMPVAQTNYGGGQQGIYVPGGTYAPEMIGLESGTINSNARSTLLHEMQHAIQHHEGFAHGGSPKSMSDQIPNPKASIYRDALLGNDPSLLRVQQLSKSPEFDAELARSNALWDREYGPRVDEIESRMTSREDFAKLQPQIDQVFEDFRAVSAKEFPTMAELEMLQRDLTARGIPLQQPSATLTPHQAYNSLAGEVEARNVQTRMDMTTEQRRAQPPWATQDVPDNLQIMRMLITGGGR